MLSITMNQIKFQTYKRISCVLYALLFIGISITMFFLHPVSAACSLTQLAGSLPTPVAAITNSFVLNGNRYALIANSYFDLLETSGCDIGCTRVPSGWQIAPNDGNSLSALSFKGSPQWMSSICVVLNDGLSFDKTRSVACGSNQLTTVTLNSVIYYSVVDCSRRILIQQVAAGVPDTYQMMVQITNYLSDQRGLLIATIDNYNPSITLSGFAGQLQLMQIPSGWAIPTDSPMVRVLLSKLVVGPTVCLLIRTARGTGTGTALLASDTAKNCTVASFTIPDYQNLLINQDSENNPMIAINNKYYRPKDSFKYPNRIIIFQQLPIVNYIVYNGYRYASLYGSSPAQAASSLGVTYCESSLRPVPVGWKVAGPSLDSNLVSSYYTLPSFATRCMVTSDGSSYYTSEAVGCGGGMLTSSTDGMAVPWYAASACDRSVLITQSASQSDTSINLQASITNTIVVGNVQYAVLSNAVPATPSPSSTAPLANSGQKHYLIIPNGWKISPNFPKKSVFITNSFSFGARCLAMDLAKSDGSVDTTAGTAVVTGTSGTICPSLSSVRSYPKTTMYITRLILTDPVTKLTTIFARPTDLATEILIENTTPGKITNSFTFGDMTYATITNAALSIDGALTETCDQYETPLPSGWSLVANTVEARLAIVGNRMSTSFGTNCVVLGDGFAYSRYSGSLCFWGGLVTTPVQLTNYYSVFSCTQFQAGVAITLSATAVARTRYDVLIDSFNTVTSNSRQYASIDNKDPSGEASDEQNTLIQILPGWLLAHAGSATFAAIGTRRFSTTCLVMQDTIVNTSYELGVAVTAGSPSLPCTAVTMSSTAAIAGVYLDKQVATPLAFYRPIYAKSRVLVSAPSDIRNYVVFNGYRWATLSFSVISAYNMTLYSGGCDSTPLPLPLGWSLSDPSDDAKVLLALSANPSYFGTDCFVFKDGSGLTPSTLTSCGSNLLVTSSPVATTVTYHVASCTVSTRILIKTLKLAKDVDLSTTTTISVANTIVFSGRRFATLDSTAPSLRKSNNGQSAFLALPNGWSLASDDAITRQAMHSPLYSFDTSCLTIANGVSLMVTTPTSPCASSKPLQSIGAFMRPITSGTRILIQQNTSDGDSFPSSLSPTNTVISGEVLFATLDNNPIGDKSLNCQLHPLVIPPGWELAESSTTTSSIISAITSVLSSNNFGTACIVTSNTKAYMSSSSPLQPCTSLYPNPSVVSPLVTFPSTALSPSVCPSRILIRRSPVLLAPQCVIYSRGNIITFDGLFQPFSTTGEFHLVSIPNVVGIQGRFAGTVSNNSPFMTGIAITVTGGSTVVIVGATTPTTTTTPVPLVYVDGIVKAFDVVMQVAGTNVVISQSGVLHYADGRWTTTTNHLTYVVSINNGSVSIVMDASIVVDASVLNSTTGLCGIYNLNESTEGEWGSAVAGLSDSPLVAKLFTMFQTTATTTSLIYPSNTTWATMNPLSVAPLLLSLDQVSSSVLDMANTACAGRGISLPKGLQSCMIDVAACNNPLVATLNIHGLALFSRMQRWTTPPPQCATQSGVLTEVTLPSSIIQVNGYRYATLDFIAVNTTTMSCHNDNLAYGIKTAQGFTSLPSGWKVAPNVPHARMAVALHRWGTPCVVFADGSSVSTVTLATCDTGGNLESHPTTEQCYRVRICNSRILIRQLDASYDTAAIPPMSSWTFTSSLISVVTMVTNTGSSGSVLQINGATNEQRTEFSASVVLTVPSTGDLRRGAFIVGCWSKAVGVTAGSPDANYSIRVSTANTAHSSFSVIGIGKFNVGTHDWQFSSVDVFSSSQIAAIKVEALFLNKGPGTAYFAGCRLRPAFYDAFSFNSGLVLAGIKAVTALSSVQLDGFLDYATGYTVAPLHPNDIIGAAGNAIFLAGGTSSHGFTSVRAVNRVAVTSNRGSAATATVGSLVVQMMVMSTGDVLLSQLSSLVTIDVLYGTTTTTPDVNNLYGIVLPLAFNRQAWRLESIRIPLKSKSIPSFIRLIGSVSTLQNGGIFVTDVTVWFLPPASAADVASLGHATSFGDPHIKTFDGSIYDLQLIGEFNLFIDKVCTTQVRQVAAAVTPNHSPSGLKGTVNAAVAVKYAYGGSDMTVSIVRGESVLTPPMIRINGTITTFPTASQSLPLDNVGMMYYRGALASATSNYVITLFFPPTGHTITIAVLTTTTEQYFNLDVIVPSSSKHSISGVFGNYNGDITDDLSSYSVSSGGNRRLVSTQATIATAAEAMRVTASSSLLPYNTGQSTTTMTDNTFNANVSSPPPPSPTSLAECATLSGVAQQLCAADIDATGTSTLTNAYPSVQSSLQSALVPILSPILIEGNITPSVTPSSSAQVPTTPGGGGGGNISWVIPVAVVCSIVGVLFIVVLFVIISKNRHHIDENKGLDEVVIESDVVGTGYITDSGVIHSSSVHLMDGPEGELRKSMDEGVLERHRSQNSGDEGLVSGRPERRKSTTRSASKSSPAFSAARPPIGVRKSSDPLSDATSRTHRKASAGHIRRKSADVGHHHSDVLRRHSRHSSRRRASFPVDLTSIDLAGIDMTDSNTPWVTRDESSEDPSLPTVTNPSPPPTRRSFSRLHVDRNEIPMKRHHWSHRSSHSRGESGHAPSRENSVVDMPHVIEDNSFRIVQNEGLPPPSAGERHRRSRSHSKPSIIQISHLDVTPHPSASHKHHKDASRSRTPPRPASRSASKSQSRSPQLSRSSSKSQSLSPNDRSPRPEFRRLSMLPNALLAGMPAPQPPPPQLCDPNTIRDRRGSTAMTLPPPDVSDVLHPAEVSQRRHSNPDRHPGIEPVPSNFMNDITQKLPQ